LVAQVRTLRPDLDVRLAFLELSEPNLVEVLRDLSGDAVVVPLLLSDAYHARIDLPTLLSDHAPPKLRVVQAPILGTDERLLRLARRRVAELGIDNPGVILTAVGSSDLTANARTQALAERLAAPMGWARATTIFATGESATLAEAADSLRSHGAAEIVVAPWFLARGLLLDRVHGKAAESGVRVAAPLGADRLVAEVVVERYVSTVAALDRRTLLPR
jgi:sirohydrochlorin ferrochelatase